MLQRQISRPKPQRFRFSWTQRAQAPTEPLPRRPAPLTATRPVVSGIPESHLNMIVSQAQGHQREYEVQEGNRQGTGPPKALAWWRCVHATQANLLCPAGCRPLNLPRPGGAAAKCGGAAGRCALWKWVSLLLPWPPWPYLEVFLCRS